MRSILSQVISCLKNDRFKKEFLPLFLCTMVALMLSDIVCIVIIFNYTNMVGLLVCGTCLLLNGLSIYYIARVHFSVIGKMAIAVQERKSFFPGTLEQKQDSLVKRITDILSETNIIKEREYAYQLLQKQAQFDAMQSQINPHFLYNAVDSIRGMALEENAPIVTDMLETLAALFRYSISSSNDLVTLKQEMDNIDSYVKIMNYRFKDRFFVIKSIEEVPPEQGKPVLEYKVPKLTLQPIIENAINHGIAPMDEKGLITIDIFRTQTRVIISVKDNGVGMDGKSLQNLNCSFMDAEYQVDSDNTQTKSDGGIALKNINARLKFSFGQSFGLVAYSTPDIGTEIVVSLPVMEDTNG